LTRQAILLLEERNDKQRHAIRAQGDSIRQEQRYKLATISSAQLRYSLLGSGLSLFVPQPNGQTHQLVIPFHSPAIAWFLPLFTRLRVVLSGPCREQ
ncbi:MAG TPA: hypothetical protein VFA10_26945, partial [Ktedonobacteraceae bacterium]|nr:hypothetical protein [Ktedonobacteraceae bacterium]